MTWCEVGSFFGPPSLLLVSISFTESFYMIPVPSENMTRMIWKPGSFAPFLARKLDIKPDIREKISAVYIEIQK